MPTSMGQKIEVSMTSEREHRCRLALLILLFGCGLPMISADHALAIDLPLTGGPGGSPDRAECPRGSYLVGLAGRTGEWVERIAPVCAPWLQGSQTFGAPTVGKFLGTGGAGQEVQSELIAGMPGKVCRGINTNNLIAVQTWHIDTLRSQNRFVQYIEVGCRSLTTPPDTGFLTFGPRSADAEERVAGMGNLSPCPVGEGIVGIHGRFGRFVDALGLICGPLPASPPVTKLPSPLVQAPSPAVTMNPQAKNMKIAADMFVITKPVPGQLIPHGQLIIVATAPDAPPTAGPPRYAELELRCLEAPSNLQFSHPYFQVITVEEAKLRRGYAVDQGVTSACSGAWQVRARFRLNAPTGPWSATVPFGLCFDHCPAMPPSPVQQTAPLPSSVIQAPPPSSAPAQMRRSPSMIMPRGVDNQKDEKEGSETADAPAESIPKP